MRDFTVLSSFGPVMRNCCTPERAMQILIATWSQQLIQHSYATPISSRLTLNNMDDSRRNRHLYNNSNLSDVVLIFGDERIHAHKDILRSKSEVFVAAFSGEFGEVNEYAIEDHSDALQSTL